MAEHSNEVVTLLGVVFALLVGVLAWIGQRVHQRLDHLSEVVGNKFDDLHEVLAATDRRHRDELVEIDRRVSRIESKCEIFHRQTQD